MSSPALSNLESRLASREHFEADDLFDELQKCYEECQQNGPENPVKRIVSHRKYNRLTATFNKNHYSNYYVPVWAAAYDYQKGYGYILYPPRSRLKPLKLVLNEIDRDVDKLIEIVRLSFAPVALAVDALHQSTNRRSGYYHRDICVENVYLPWVTYEGSSKYGEAKLRLTEKTRQVYDPDLFDQQSSLQEIPRDYFRYPGEGSSFKKDLDWYSFGIYIAMCCIHTTLAEEEGGNDDYFKWSNISTPADSGTTLYCLEHQAHPALEAIFPIYYEMGQSLGSRHIFFNDEMLKDMDDYPNTCSACLLRPPDDLHVRAYWKGAVRRRKDTSSLKFVPGGLCSPDTCSGFYCSGCYKNGERLFCQYHNAPTSPVIGPNCFALILYGNHFHHLGKEKQHDFRWDAHRLASTLMHMEVRGIPPDNIIIQALYGEGKSGEDLLKDACDEMYNKIHQKKGSPECTNGSDYQVIIYYSGHGKGGAKDEDTPDGSWATTKNKNCKGDWEKDWILYDDIQKHTLSIRGIIESKPRPVFVCADDHCHGSCTEVIWIMDHCKAENDRPKVCKRFREEEPDSWVVTAADSPNLNSSENESDEPFSEIIYLISEILRSNHVNYSADISFVKPSSFAVHAKSTKSFKYALKESRSGPVVSIFDHRSYPHDTTGLRIVVSYANPEGTEHRVLSIQDGKPFPIPPTLNPCDLDAVNENLLDSFNKEKKKSSKVPATGIMLYSTATNDDAMYSLIFDSDVRPLLDASSITKENRTCANAALYFSGINKRTRVLLIPKHTDDTETIDVDIDVEDAENALDLNPDIARERPNILVYIVHKFYKMWNHWKKTGEQVDGKSARVCNDFLGHLYEPKWDLDMFDQETSTEARWKQLAHEAGSRRRSKRDLFFVQNMESEVALSGL